MLAAFRRRGTAEVCSIVSHNIQGNNKLEKRKTKCHFAKDIAAESFECSSQRMNMWWINSGRHAFFFNKINSRKHIIIYGLWQCFSLGILYQTNSNIQAIVLCSISWLELPWLQQRAVIVPMLMLLFIAHRKKTKQNKCPMWSAPEKFLVECVCVCVYIYYIYI